MSLTIPIAHDFICPWCWAGLLQARKLQDEFGIKLDWKGYELFPDELEWPDWPPAPPAPANKPPTPSRFDFLLLADGIELPATDRPKKMRTHNAHEAVEYAKTEGVHDQLIEALYRAYWQGAKEINNPAVLREVATGIVKDLDALSAAVESREFKENIVGFDDPAYAAGVYNVPTFFINGKSLAEQPYVVLQKALKEVV
jgi:predicted DsbA family dithiol-disulfide isomerase